MPVIAIDGEAIWRAKASQPEQIAGSHYIDGNPSFSLGTMLRIGLPRRSTPRNDRKRALRNLGLKEYVITL